MGLIINQKIPYGGGGGKGLLYWKEEEESITNESEPAELTPEAKVETIDLTQYSKMYKSFPNQIVSPSQTFLPSSSSSTNYAKTLISSWCFPALSDNFDQPEPYTFRYSYRPYEFQTNVKDMQVSLPGSNDRWSPSYEKFMWRSANSSIKSSDIINEVYDDTKYLTYELPQNTALEISYRGYINLNVYNNKTYGDIAGIQGYNEDYGYAFTWDKAKISLATLREKLEHVCKSNWKPEDNYSYSLEEQVEIAINHFKKDVLTAVSTTTSIPGGGTVVTIDMPNLNYYRIQIKGLASMGDGTTEEFAEWFVVDDIRGTIYPPSEWEEHPPNKTTVHGKLEMCRNDTGHQEHDNFKLYFNEDDSASSPATSTITSIYAEVNSDIVQQLYELVYMYGYNHPEAKCSDFYVDVLNFLEDCEYAITDSVAQITNKPFNYVNYPYSHQSKEPRSRTLTRNHTSDYLEVNKTIPFIFKVICLGKLYKYKQPGYYTDYDPYDYITDFTPISKGISGNEHISSLDPLSFAYGGEEFTIFDYDLDNNDKAKINELTYKDRTLARHGIIMDDNNIAWYIYLSPAKSISDETDDSYFVTTFKDTVNGVAIDKQLSYLNIGETPNHWAYYEGANPTDTTVTYSKTHKNGLTFNFTFDTLSEQSEEQYHSNFIELAKKIVSSLKVKGIKPYFDIPKIKTGIYVGSSDGMAFSSGLMSENDDSYTEMININGATGNIKTNGNIKSDEDIFGRQLYENESPLSQIYQQKLIAGENITIEDNVISASGGGGGGSHAYTTTPQIIGTWTDGRNIYEQSLYASRQSSALQPQYYQGITIVTGLQLPDGHDVTNVELISIEGSIRDNRVAYPISYGYGTTMYILPEFRPALSSDKLQFTFSLSKGGAASIYGYTVTFKYVI